MGHVAEEKSDVLMIGRDDGDQRNRQQSETRNTIPDLVCLRSNRESFRPLQRRIAQKRLDLRLQQDARKPLFGAVFALYGVLGSQTRGLGTEIGRWWR